MSLTPSRARRWMIGILVALMALLSGYSFLDSRRHAQLVEEILFLGEQVSNYQHAAYLSASEMTLIESALAEPDGVERQELLAADDQTYLAIKRIADTDNEAQDVLEADTIAQRQLNMRQQILWFLATLDRGERAQATSTLENLLEPAYRRNMGRLLELRDVHQARYDEFQATARRDSRRLSWGSTVSAAMSLIILALFVVNTRAHRRQVESMATTDPLTGLPNRSAFTAHTQNALTSGPTVLTVNINGFRQVNDQLGPHIGDQLLAETGWRLSAVVRDSDLVARVGGDEFAILLRDTSQEQAESVAGRLLEAFDQPFQLDGMTVDLEISIGAATASAGDDVNTLLGHADSAMHEAKQQHHGFRRFSEDTAQESADRLRLLGDLRRALTDDEQFTLHYQAKIRLDNGTMTGVESLARWSHPTKGPVYPGQFIPVLETTSLIHPFTERVLTIALQQARAWLDDGHRVPVAVNVSTRSLLDETFPNRLAALLEYTGVPGDLLCIEITEHTVLADPSTTIEALNQVRGLGVKTSIDDFGTGYSSMTYLKLLPVDELKIDRSFVADMVTDPSSHALVMAAVDLAHNLGLTVVAEGVEDAATAEALNKLGCDTAQGYHFARPVPATELTSRFLGVPASGV
jgi:diguanylate cyclase (GGDEF)-like protein